MGVREKLAEGPIQRHPPGLHETTCRTQAYGSPSALRKSCGPLATAFQAVDRPRGVGDMLGGQDVGDLGLDGKGAEFIEFGVQGGDLLCGHTLFIGRRVLDLRVT